MALVIVVLLLLLIVVPTVEIAVIIAVGNWLGPIPTVLLLVASSVVGVWLLRHQGRRSWWAFRDAARAGRTPATEASEGVLVLLAGLLMVLPGFVTDLIGVVLILPPVRRFAGRRVLQRVARRLPPELANEVLGPMRVKARRGAAGDVHTPGPRRSEEVIEGEIEH